MKKLCETRTALTSAVQFFFPSKPLEGIPDPVLYTEGHNLDFLQNCLFSQFCSHTLECAGIKFLHKRWGWLKSWFQLDCSIVNTEISLLFLPLLSPLEFTFGLWSKKQSELRNERDPEFAPPSSYYMSQNRVPASKSQNWNKAGSSYDEREPNPAESLPSQSAETNGGCSQSSWYAPTQASSSDLQNDEAVYHSLDDMLSYYKQVT